MNIYNTWDSTTQNYANWWLNFLRHTPDSTKMSVGDYTAIMHRCLAEYNATYSYMTHTVAFQDDVNALLFMIKFA